jgi:ubiquinone biosynthesis monooxygenase Coq7
MGQREFSISDRLFGEIDKAIKVLAAPAHASRAIPEAPPAAAGTAPTLTAADRQLASRLMRINHAGEVAAQALYQGQALTARNEAVAAEMRQAASEETDHLAWCEQRISELGGRTSVLNPLWYAGSWAIGALAGAIGDRVSLGFITETEKQVESHLQSHLQRLPESDTASRAILEQMKTDEIRHGARAEALGGMSLPLPIRAAMRLTSRLMTSSTYWI